MQILDLNSGETSRNLCPLEEAHQEREPLKDVSAFTTFVTQKVLCTLSYNFFKINPTYYSDMSCDKFNQIFLEDFSNSKIKPYNWIPDLKTTYKKRIDEFVLTIWLHPYEFNNFYNWSQQNIDYQNRYNVLFFEV